MLRTTGAILTGFAVFAMVAGLSVLAARAGWPAYAAAEKQRAFSLFMLLMRLAVGMMATLGAGAAAAWVSRGAKQATLMFGIFLLLISTVEHIRIWEQYPVWYHLFYLAYLIPLAMVGARLGSIRITR